MVRDRVGVAAWVVGREAAAAGADAVLGSGGAAGLGAAGPKEFLPNY